MNRRQFFAASALAAVAGKVLPSAAVAGNPLMIVSEIGAKSIRYEPIGDGARWVKKLVVTGSVAFNKRPKIGHVRNYIDMIAPKELPTLQRLVQCSISEFANSASYTITDTSLTTAP